MNLKTWVFLLLLLPMLLLAETPNTGDFWIGIVRIDGALIPFAKHEDGKWTKPWPEADQKCDQTISKSDQIPKQWFGKRKQWSSKWNFIGKDGRNLQLRVGDVSLVESHCSVVWSLKTDYQPKKTIDYAPFPKSGLALDRKINIRSISKLKDKYIPKKMMSIIMGYFNEQESKASQTGKYPTDQRWFPKEESARIKTPMEFNIYSDGERSFPKKYYIEIFRRYRTAPEENSGYSYVRMWFVDQGGRGFKIIKSNIWICDGDGCNDDITTEPLGVMTIMGVEYWVIENHYYESESYSIIQFDESEIKIVLDFEGGGC